MSKLLGSICLVAGSTIGAGMLALPLTIASLGFPLGIVAMSLIWYVMYQAALFGLEVNLRYAKGAPLGVLAARYGGPYAQFLGHVSVSVLGYALVSAYLFGGTSLILSFWEGTAFSFGEVLILMTLAIMMGIGTCTTWLDKTNRVLFLIMIGAFFFLMIGLLGAVSSGALHYVPESATQLTSWRIALPILFTSFGFHLLLGSMVEYCEKDVKMLRRAFFWGSLIPFSVYVAWVLVALGVLFESDPDFYQVLIKGHGDLGQLMEKLGHVAAHPWAQQCRWIVGFLAIFTSALGVGLSLVEGWASSFNRIPQLKMPLALLASLLPCAAVAYFIPEAFMKALGVSGMLLAIIAVLLPCYLLFRSDEKTYYFKESGSRLRILLCIFVATSVVCLELYNLLKGIIGF